MEENDIIEFLTGNADLERKAKILGWINSSDENREEYFRLKNLIALTGKTVVTKQKSEKELVQLLRKISGNKKAKIRQLLFNVSKYAAAIIITLIVARFVIPSSFQRQADNMWFEISTPSGQTAQMVLPDGTHVWMNSLTNLKYPTDFSTNNREVQISGEAFFNVTHDQSSPFLVKTNKYSIKVLGTSFNVSAYPNDLISKTTLVDGKIVLLNADDKEIKTLTPGQLFAYNTSDMSFEISRVSTDYYTSWKDGYFAFDREKLESIAAKLERIYAVKINIPDDKIRNISFTGTIMKNKPLEQILRIIELTAPIIVTIERISEKEDQVTIESKN